MKLDEINILVDHKNTFYDLQSKLKTMDRPPRGLTYYNMSELQDDEINRAVHAVARTILLRKLDEVKTKLMLLGFDEFPD